MNKTTSNYENNINLNFIHQSIGKNIILNPRNYKLLAHGEGKTEKQIKENMHDTSKERDGSPILDEIVPPTKAGLRCLQTTARVFALLLSAM